MKLTFTKHIQRGQTLVELLLYMGLLTILLSVLSSIFGSTIDAQLESKSTSSVDQDGRYIIARLEHDFNSIDATSTNISTPATPGSTTSTLTITISSVNNTYSLSNGNLQLTNSNGTDNLNSSDTKVSNLSFTRIGTGSSKDTVQASFTLTSTTQRTKGAETRNFQTTLSGINVDL